MKHYTVRITNQVVEDMEKLYTYIAVQLRAPENAMRQYDRIAEAILTLDRFPERFGCFHTEPEYSMGIRRMVVDNFLVCYVIESDVVTVTNVLYGASDVRQRLKNRREGGEGKSLLVHECLVVDLNYEVCDFFRASCSLALCWSGCHTCAKIQVMGSGFCKKHRTICLSMRMKIKGE